MPMKPNVEALAPLLKGYLGTQRAETPARRFEPQQRPTETVSDAFVEQLNAHAVDCIFINPGSDVAPIQESIAKFDAQNRRAPRLVLCPHESVALAAAHGYFMVTGDRRRAGSCDVGTEPGANLHTQRRAGVVICAGTAPHLPGGAATWTDPGADRSGRPVAVRQMASRRDATGDLRAAMQRPSRSPERSRPAPCM
jgi:hypothetical protein